MKIALIFILTFTIQNSFSAVDGSKPYTPSSLEWMYFNCISLIANNHAIDLKFQCQLEEPNTVSVITEHKGKNSQKLAGLASSGLAANIKKYAKNKGWIWLKIKAETLNIDNMSEGKILVETLSF